MYTDYKKRHNEKQRKKENPGKEKRSDKQIEKIREKQ